MTTNDPDPTPFPAAQPPPLPPGVVAGAAAASAAPWPYPPPGDVPAGYPPIGYWPAPTAAPPPPPVWPALVVPIMAVVVAMVTSTVALLVAAAADIGLGGLSNPEQLMDWVQSYGATPLGFLVLVLPGQLVFLAAALAAGWLSPDPLRRRLGLVRPSVPWWALLLLVGATPAVGMCGDLLMTMLFEQRSEHLEMMYKLLGGRTGLFLVLVTLSISVVPGFAEEMLFRGYTQRRLLRRWHPAAAVGVSGVLFAAAHLDPAHVVGVLPLGIWLGVMAWLCGSIWPSIVCHTVNNATAVLLTNLDPALATEPVKFEPLDLTILGVSGLCLALSLWVMLRYR